MRRLLQIFQLLYIKELWVSRGTYLKEKMEHSFHNLGKRIYLLWFVLVKVASRAIWLKLLQELYFVLKGCTSRLVQNIVTRAALGTLIASMPESSQFPGSHGRSGGRLNINERVTPSSKDNYHVIELDNEERALFEIEENKFRKTYCSFLKDVGLKLRMPHVVVATATIYCHRFFAHQSREKNDQYIIATACIFLAGKVEEARRALEEVIFVTYCLLNKLTSLTFEEFKKKDTCDRQKELVLLAEHFVLVNLDFNLEVKHPYSFILTAVPKYKPASEILSGVSLIILNDVLYTTLYLRFKPQHIAAAALLLAAKLVKFKFPSKDWWKEFGVKMNQLEEICNQILEFYEQERGPFCMVQSSSSSSSIDARAKGLIEQGGSKPRSQSYLMDGSQNSYLMDASQNSCLTKSTRSQNPVLRPPMTGVPGVRLKPGSY